MWPFNDTSVVESLPDFINRLMSTEEKDLNTALTLATTSGDKIGANCYSVLLAEKTKLMAQLGLKEGDTVGPIAMAQLLHVLNANKAMQADILATIQLACAPMVQRTITDVGSFLTQAAGLVSLAAPIAIPAA